jgi:hypothetical protein
MKVAIISTIPITTTNTCVVHNIQADHKEEQYNDPFAPTGIPIHNYRQDDFDGYKFYETEPSKFISKPKNNFKKR